MIVEVEREREGKTRESGERKGTVKTKNKKRPIFSPLRHVVSISRVFKKNPFLHAVLISYSPAVVTYLTQGSAWYPLFSITFR